eukprot:121191-Hanusia_phi.AAC.1
MQQRDGVEDGDDETPVCLPLPLEVRPQLLRKGEHPQDRAPWLGNSDGDAKVIGPSADVATYGNTDIDDELVAVAVHRVVGAAFCCEVEDERRGLPPVASECGRVDLGREINEGREEEEEEERGMGEKEGRREGRRR